MALGRALALVVALYTTVDFGSPLVPGAFVFDAAESLDGVRGPRPRPEVRLAVVVPTPGPVPVVLAQPADRPGRPRPATHPAPRLPRPRSAPAAEPYPAVDDP